MVDEPATNRPAELVCTWCSTAITPETAVCPSCGAILNADEEPELPGVTAVDAAAALRTAKSPASTAPPPARSRIMSWISGPSGDEAQLGKESAALAPPDPEVQREILRLELEAEVANLQAEYDAAWTEAQMEGRVIEIPDEMKPLLEGEDASTDGEAAADDGTPTEAPAAGTDAGDEAPAAEDDAKA